MITPFRKNYWIAALLYLLLASYGSLAQSTLPCNMFADQPFNKLGTDTITVQVKYFSWTMNIPEQRNRMQQDFFRQLEKQYGLRYTILCQPLSCDSLFSIPIIARADWEGYFFKLSDKRNPTLRCGQVLELTLVRYPQKLTQANTPFYLIVQFKPTTKILPVKLTPYLQKLHGITGSCEEYKE
jgi:hypothetical protein